MFQYCFSETSQGWKFGLTPLLSLGAKADKVIREILPKMVALIAFKVGHANFPTCINCLTAELKLSRNFFVDRPESYSATHSKNCIFIARFALNFSIFLLCQLKIPDKKNTSLRHVYLLGKNINKPLVRFY